jgi:hypothetical protein
MNKIAYIALCSIALYSAHSTCGESDNGERHGEVFTYIYKNNFWGDPESVSGSGSNLYQTETIRKELPKLLKDFSVTSMLDLPCGDFNWVKTLALDNVSYVGMDIVQEIIDNNNKLYANQARKFVLGNAITDTLPKSDLIFCRDMLVHFTLDDAKKVLRNFKQSGSRLLLITAHLQVEENTDIPTGEWRKINFAKAPFNFPAPLLVIHEKSPDPKEFDKSLALYALDEINLD